nr:MAG TPA: hypothetical protein [Caudoviricetes sp.]DAM44700.1 MAG TPA: hypothetical protein [Caudoviricetes sp.]
MYIFYHIVYTKSSKTFLFFNKKVQQSSWTSE